MIKYYDTEAAYAADAKSPFESQVSLVGEDNEIKYDGRNVVVGAKSAKTGSIVVLDGNSAMHFIALDTFSSSSFMSNFTIVGVVAVGVDHPDFRGKIVIVHKSNASKMWSAIYSFKLTGYTLDGTDRSGKLKVYSAASTYDTYTINYNADSVADFLTTLNAYFQSTAPFTTQHWRADADSDGNITLSFLFTFADQRSCAGSDGFTLTANLLPGIPASTAMLRYNGQRSGEGCISNMARAIAYFSADLNNATYNPTSTVTSPKRSYPICKPGYLGTSQYSNGDQCAALRAIYGEGEAGWLKFMESFYPIRPSKYGPIGDKATYGDSKRNTGLMAGKTFTKQDNTVIPAYPAADYCGSVTYNHDLLKRGQWFLPDVDVLCSVLRTIKYNSTNDRNADPVNRALYAIGGTAISNGSLTWSSSRCLAYRAWYSVGSGGFLGNVILYGTYLAVPVALLDVSEANI
jgi:hypothetical protein